MNVNNGKPILVKVKNTEDFYFTFIQMFQQQLKIKSLTDVHVLTKFCLMMEYNSTKVKLTAGARKQLCDDIGIKMPHLSNSIGRLKEFGIIRGKDGEYEVNPFFAWKGKLSEREKLLSMNGVEIKLKFGTGGAELPYNPFKGGSKEFDS